MIYRDLKAGKILIGPRQSEGLEAVISDFAYSSIDSSLPKQEPYGAVTTYPYCSPDTLISRVRTTVAIFSPWGISWQEYFPYSQPGSCQPETAYTEIMMTWPEQLALEDYGAIYLHKRGLYRLATAILSVERRPDVQARFSIIEKGLPNNLKLCIWRNLCKLR